MAWLILNLLILNMSGKPTEKNCGSHTFILSTGKAKKLKYIIDIYHIVRHRDYTHYTVAFLFSAAEKKM